MGVFSSSSLKIPGVLLAIDVLLTARSWTFFLGEDSLVSSSLWMGVFSDSRCPPRHRCTLFLVLNHPNLSFIMNSVNAGHGPPTPSCTGRRVGQKTRCVNNQNTCMLWPFPSINAAISQNFKALGPCLRGSPEMSLFRKFLEMPAYSAFINQSSICSNIYFWILYFWEYLCCLVTGHLTWPGT